jgi:ParB/RepB/Spo0J family partition protein
LSANDIAREFKDLPLAIIDRPQLDARIERSPEFLEALTGSIRRDGVLVPLIVVRAGERYEVVDGFTRYIAATRAGLAVVPCCIYPTKETALEGVKYTATQFHEKFSPADEAIFFNELFKNECGEDIDKLCVLVNKGFDYVSGRLELLNGDPEVFEAVRAGKVKLGVAAELNKIDKDDYRRYYLGHAIRDGVTTAGARRWVGEYQAMYGDREQLAPAPAPQPTTFIAKPNDLHYCEVCRESDPRFIPELIPVHTHCKEAILKRLLDAYHGGN